MREGGYVSLVWILKLVFFTHWEGSHIPVGIALVHVFAAVVVLAHLYVIYHHFICLISLFQGSDTCRNFNKASSVWITRRTCSRSKFHVINSPFQLYWRAPRKSLCQIAKLSHTKIASYFHKIKYQKGSKLGQIYSPMRLTFSPWHLKILV